MLHVLQSLFCHTQRHRKQFDPSDEALPYRALPHLLWIVDQLFQQMQSSLLTLFAKAYLVKKQNQVHSFEPHTI